MKKVIGLLVFFIFILSCKNKVVSDSIIISVPDTLSSIPVYQLDGEIVDNKSIQVQTYSDHSMAMLEFINGTTQIILTGFTQGVANRKENPEIVILSTIVWGISSIMVKDRNIESIFNRDNTKIALPFQGSPLDIQFKSIISAKGIENKFQVIIGKLDEWKELKNSIESTGIILYGPYINSNIKGKKHLIVYWESIGKNRGAFLNKLYGFKTKDKKYSGLIEISNWKKLGKSSMLIPIEDKNKLFDLIKKYKVNSKILEVYY